MLKYIALLGFALVALKLSAQDQDSNRDHAEGIVFGTNNGKLEALPGAHVFWVGTMVGTNTNRDGSFKLEPVENENRIAVSFVGYAPDTMVWSGADLTFKLAPGIMLGDAEISYQRQARELNLMNPLNVEELGQKELKKAACCNLSESFETNASVDASFTDALTGTRQIRMLGLDGKYTQIMQDNIPFVRGLTSIYGLTFIPGSWIDRIAIAKGAGSVTNGFESMTGQIQVKLKHPYEDEKLHVNMYANQGGRTEVNVNYAFPIAKNWDNMVYIHGEWNDLAMDRNNDSFLDNPLKQDLVVRNLLTYNGTNGLESKIAAQYIIGESNTGQQAQWLQDGASLYNIDRQYSQLNLSAKTGYVFQKAIQRSIGSQFSWVQHENESNFGDLAYRGTQRSFRANILFNTIIGTTDHSITTGVSFVHDDFDETFGGNAANPELQAFSRIDQVVGAYAEYDWSYKEVLKVIAGVRGDYHMDHGFFFLPRLNARYSINENTSVKGAAGRGFRMANVFMENVGLLASSRDFQIRRPFFGALQEAPVLPGEGYGLDPEVSWNFGLNLTKKFQFNYREASWTVDVYHTYFENQVVTDVDQNPQQAIFYNLENASYSNSIQTEINLEPAKRFELRLAYRWLDVRTQYLSGWRSKPLLASHRLFSNLAYATKKTDKNRQWVFDLTTTWTGEQRIPNTTPNPEAFQREAYSDDFVLLNAQVTFVASKKWEFYVGGENLTNYTQQNPILSAENPQSEFFDGSLVWAPIFGSMAYAGLRFTLMK